MNDSIPYLITMENGCELELHTDCSRPYFEIDRNKGVVVYLDEMLTKLQRFDSDIEEYLMCNPDKDEPHEEVRRLVDAEDFSNRCRVLYERFMALGWNDIQSMKMTLSCMERVEVNYIE